MGTSRDQTLSETHGSDGQEVAIPETGQRDMCGHSPGNAIPVLSHVGTIRGRQGILDGTI